MPLPASAKGYSLWAGEVENSLKSAKEKEREEADLMPWGKEGQKVREGVGKPSLVPALGVSVLSCLPISISFPRDLGRLRQAQVASRLGLQLERQGKGARWCRSGARQCHGGS